MKLEIDIFNKTIFPIRERNIRILVSRKTIFVKKIQSCHSFSFAMKSHLEGLNLE